MVNAHTLPRDLSEEFKIYRFPTCVELWYDSDGELESEQTPWVHLGAGKLNQCENQAESKVYI